MFWKKYKKLINYMKTIDQIWFIVWIIIYVGFLSLDAVAPGFLGVTLLRYIGIVLCFVYAYQKFKDDSLMIIALGFTVLADTVLVVNSTSIIGVFVFCFAQFFHAARFRKTSPTFLIYYFVCIIAVFFGGVLMNLTPMYIIAAVYAGTLLTNIVLSAKWYFKNHSIMSGCAFYGFILFFCCDFCVALSYLSYTSVIPSHIYPIANYLAWLFYYPSQIAISNSSVIYAKKPIKSFHKPKTVLK